MNDRTWLQIFLSWLDGETDTLDFEGKEIPPRLQQLLQAGLDPRHYCEIRPGGWTLQHPFSCRPNLLDCEVNQMVQADAEEAERNGGIKLVPGRYEVSLVERKGQMRVVFDEADWPKVQG